MRSACRAGYILMGAFALVASGCLLRDPKLVEDAGSAPEDPGQHPSGGSGGSGGGAKGGAGGSGAKGGAGGGGAKYDSGASGARGGAGGSGAKGGAGGSGDTEEEGGAGAGGQGGSGGTAGAADPDVCASSVCRAEYPCQALDSGYTCRGQFADWSPAYNATAFTATNGTVEDSRSGLVWQQSVPSSYAPACSGKYGSDSPAGDACTWEDAKKYCAGLSLAGGGWRLPTKAELESLVDFSRVVPAIDQKAFPDTPSNTFWSSSPSAGSSGYAWVVSFSDGSSYQSDPSDTYRVRCVR